MDMKREKRNVSLPLEIRKGENGEESRRIEGYALVFNSRSEDLGGFTEIIAPEALEGVLERSDILALLNHSTERGVLARFRNGGGSLELTVDETGLRYSFEAPRTALGDEVLEGVRRGDISGSSFAFTVRDEQWTEESEGRYLRTIRGFDQLFDVSPVYHPAYEATSVEVDSRGLEEFKRLSEPSAGAAQEQKNADGGNPEEPQEPEPPEEPQEPEPTPEPKEPEPEPETNAAPQEPEPEERNKEEKKEFTIYRSMKKQKFSLLQTIRAVAERKEFNEASAFAIEQGREAARAAGISCDGHIQLAYEPKAEMRFEDAPNGIISSQNPDAAGFGGEDVPTDLFDLLGPLEERLVVTQLGARMLNLSGNVEIPFYDGATSEWESEIGEAMENDGKFSTIKMSPKRIATSLPISKQFLIQTDARSEALIRDNLVNSIMQKLQSTLLGDGAGDDVTPRGLMYGVAGGTPLTYADPIEWERELEEAKIYGEKKYVVSPSAKAALRTTKIDEGSGRFVMEGNEIYGVPAMSTGSMVKDGLILGDWSQLYIASFGALDLTVDTVTRAKKGQVLLVVNSWFDYVTVRPQAFVKKLIK